MATAIRRRPHRASLVEWFEAAAGKPGVAHGLLGLAAVGYSVGVALPLSIAGALPMPDPFLRIPNADYFFWGTFFYAPVIVGAWMLASVVMFLLSRADFGSLLRLTAFATGIGTLGTLLSDLITSPLRAIGVINEQVWEQSIADQTGWFVFIWAWMALYLALFLVAYPIAVRIASHASWPKAIAVGVAGFAVFQGFEYIFIR